MPRLQRCLIICLISLVFLASAYAGSVQLAWDAPITNEDGSPLTDLAGYIVYYGVSSGVYDASLVLGLSTTATVSNLAEGYTYFFAVTAYDTCYSESLPSNEVSYFVPPPDPGDVTPPQVAITSPMDGAMVPRKGLVTIQVQASDDSGSVAEVTIYVNDQPLCSDTLAPFACTWYVPAAPNRQYVLDAIGMDAAGNVGVSAPVVVISQ